MDARARIAELEREVDLLKLMLFELRQERDVLKHVAERHEQKIHQLCRQIDQQQRLRRSLSRAA